MQEITGIEEEDKITEHLRSHQWDLEAAVQDALNEKEGIRPIFTSMPPAPTSSPPGTQSTGSPAEDDLELPSPSARLERRSGREVVRREGWLMWSLNLAVFPLRFILSAANEIFQFIGAFPFQGRVCLLL